MYAVYVGGSLDRNVDRIQRKQGKSGTGMHLRTKLMLELKNSNNSNLLFFK